MKREDLQSYALNTLLMVALCASYKLLGGMLSLVIGLIISALLGQVMQRKHFMYGIFNSLIIVVIFTLFSDVVTALTTGIPLILLAASLAIGTRLRLPLPRLLLLCTFLYVMDLVFSLGFVSHATGGETTLSAMMLDTGRQMKELLLTQYSDADAEKMIEQVVSTVIDLSIKLAPAMFMMISTLLSYILIVIYKKMQMRQGVDMAFLLPFDKLQGEKLTAVIYIVLVLMLTAVPAGMFFDVLANVCLFLSFLYFAIGLSCFDWNLKQRGTKKMARRIFIAVLICCSSMLFMLPVLAMMTYGMTDCFFDYRHLRKTTDGADKPL